MARNIARDARTIVNDPILSKPSPPSVEHSQQCLSIEKEGKIPQTNEKGCRWDKSTTVTTLFCACRSGKTEVVKLLLKNNIKAGGAQESLNNQTCLHAAHYAGDYDSVTMIILCGEKPEKDNNGKFPDEYNNPQINRYQAQNLLKVWGTYKKAGFDGVRVAYPQLANDIIPKMKISSQETSIALKAIDEYISKHPELPNLASKVRENMDAKDENLYPALEYLLHFFKFRFTEGKNLQDMYNDYLKSLEEDDDLTASTKGHHKPGIISACTKIFNVNIFILLYNFEKKSVTIKKHYVNSNKKSDFPCIYLTYSGAKYDPVVTDKSFKAVFLSSDKILELVEDPKSTADAFTNALTMFDLSKINDLYPYKPLDSTYNITATILYHVVRAGRSDFFQVLLGVEGIKFDGPQESYNKNTPLHVASWRGHYNIVAMLLFIGADAKIKNQNNEEPNMINAGLPQKNKDEIEKIWKCYAKGMSVFKEEYKNFIVTSDRPEIQTNVILLSTSPSSEYQHVLASGPVTTAQLCSMLDGDNPPKVAEFREILKRFDKKQINQVCVMAKATPLYTACRKGHLDIVRELLDIENIKISGGQETWSGHGNTCLHVSNWRGHYRIVALLLLHGAQLEVAGQNNVDPSHHKERNFMLPQETRGTLQSLFFSYKKGGIKVENEKKYIQSVLDTPEVDCAFSGSKPLPLWAVIGIPKDELPQQYLKLDYFWYVRPASGGGDRMTLLGLTESSHLNATFLRYRKNPDKTTWETLVPVPPSTGIFNSSTMWSYAKWTVNFQAMQVTVKTEKETKQLLIAAISRSKTWFYSTQPGKDGPYVPFPNSVCNKISAAYTSKMPAIQFPFSLEKGFFSKPGVCLVNFERKECIITQNNISTTHKILIEDDYNNRTYWEPDSFYRFTPNYPHNEITPVELKRDSEEFKKVESYFYLTMPQADKNNKPINVITKVTRIFYPHLRGILEDSEKSARSVFDSDPKFQNSFGYTKLLWHGTGGTDPMIIASSGWKINYSTNKNLWGRGTYFASDASYSAAYSYQDKKSGHRMMFLAQVITGLGLQCYENTNLIDVPKGYNSIVGLRHGSWIYVAFDSQRAFPTYLVEWAEKQK